MKARGQRFSVRGRMLSFRYAWAGISVLFRTGHNMRVHLAAALLAIALGWYCDLGRMEWIALAGCIAAVFAAESFNTALEELCNVVHPGQHPTVGKIKDMAAAAVLFIAAAALLVGLLIFWPYLRVIFR